MASDNLDDLFQQARADGVISGASAQALSIVDYGAEIQPALGISVDDVPTSETFLITILMDDSSSMESNRKLATAGFNMLIDDVMKNAPERESILVHTQLLNAGLYCPFTFLEHVPRMTSANYVPRGNTPLYDRTFLLLETLLRKLIEHQQAAVFTRSATVIVSDGGDNASRHHSPRSIASLVHDLQRMETNLILAMGVNDGQTDFRQVFRSMGLEDHHILTPGSSPLEWQRAFQFVTRTVSRATQGVSGFTAVSRHGIS
ncbi:MAG TPA: hypothetical protein VFZ25_21880 [Chloroflexota bacterium]|nr:hypothetical protein [Chloroflexota bacterium]